MDLHLPIRSRLAVLSAVIVGVIVVGCSECGGAPAPPEPAGSEPLDRLPAGIARLLEEALAEQVAGTHAAVFPPDAIVRAATECDAEDWMKKARERRRKVMGALKQLRRSGAELFDAELAGAVRRQQTGDRIGNCTVRRSFDLQQVDLLFVGEQPGGRYRESRQVTCVRFDGDERWFLMAL